jgi:hypothetical protein
MIKEKKGRKDKWSEGEKEKGSKGKDEGRKWKDELKERKGLEDENKTVP